MVIWYMPRLRAPPGRPSGGRTAGTRRSSRGGSQRLRVYSLVMRHAGVGSCADADVDRRAPGVQRVEAGQLTVRTDELLASEGARVA